VKTISYQVIRDEAKELYESYLAIGDDSGPSFLMCLEHILETYLASGYAVVAEFWRSAHEN